MNYAGQTCIWESHDFVVCKCNNLFNRSLNEAIVSVLGRSVGLKATQSSMKYISEKVFGLKLGPKDPDLKWDHSDRSLGLPGWAAQRL